MNLRRGFFCGSANFQIGIAGERRVNATLHAHFSRAALPGFAHASGDLRQLNHVGLAAQFFVGFAFGKCAEAAVVKADVGVVNVARDHVTHRVTNRGFAQLICCAADVLKVTAARVK